MSNRLPVRLFTWPPVALGSLFFLTVGFATASLSPETAPSVLLGYLLIFAFVWLVSLTLANKGMSYAITFTCLFLLTQAIQIPSFEIEPPQSLPHASLFSAAAAFRAILEVGIMFYLVRRLVLNDEDSQTVTTLGLVALTLIHGTLWAWELPLRQGEPLTWSSYSKGVTAWFVFTSLQLGVVFITSRLRRGWSQTFDPNMLENPAPADDTAKIDGKTNAYLDGIKRESGRPTPRNKHRRR